MLNAQEDVITDVRMSIEIMTYVLQMSKLQAQPFKAGCGQRLINTVA